MDGVSSVGGGERRIGGCVLEVELIGYVGGLYMGFGEDRVEYVFFWMC